MIIDPEDSWSRPPQGSLLLIGGSLSARLGKRCQMADRRFPSPPSMHALSIGFSGLRLAHVLYAVRKNQGPRHRARTESHRIDSVMLLHS